MAGPGHADRLGGLLVVTAVAAERDACAGSMPVEEIRLGPLTALRTHRVVFVAGGVGPAAVAASTAAALANGRFDAVLCAGIGGGFGADLLVAADTITFADLGAESGGGFLPLSQLGFGAESVPVGPAVVNWLGATGAAIGEVLTVTAVTGTAATAAARRARHPRALAEGMEGAGVAAAAGLFGVPFGELRAVSNPVGPRDRAGWDIPGALATLRGAVAALADAGWTS